MNRDPAAEMRQYVKPEPRDPTIRYHVQSSHQSMCDTEHGAVVIAGRGDDPDLIITFADTEAARGFALNAVDVLACRYDAEARP